MILKWKCNDCLILIHIACIIVNYKLLEMVKHSLGVDKIERLVERDSPADYHNQRLMKKKKYL